MSVNDGRVVSNFICQALQNKEITIYGDGKQTRSFCYVDDLIEGIIKFSLKDRSFSGPINLGNPHEMRIIDIANTIIDLTNSKSIISFHPLPSDDPVKRNPDISVASKTLEWNPKIEFKEGIIKTIEFLKKHQVIPMLNKKITVSFIVSIFNKEKYISLVRSYF